MGCFIIRRKSNVPGPNNLWQSDEHHSLVNWGFVIDGGKDGLSRSIVNLKDATNNRNETVCGLFADATSKFRVPCRVRREKGGENVMV